MIDVKQILSEFKSFFENLINIRALNGRIVESTQTVSFYIYKDRLGCVPMQIFRISDHRPDLYRMIKENTPNPSQEEFANLSIEFYVPKFFEGNGGRVQNKLKTKVKTYDKSLKPFSVDSYSYTPELLTKDDFGLIFASIMKWLFPNQDVGLRPYIDPFANTSKRAIYKKGVSKIVLKGSLGI